MSGKLFSGKGPTPKSENREWKPGTGTPPSKGVPGLAGVRLHALCAGRGCKSCDRGYIRSL